MSHLPGLELAPHLLHRVAQPRGRGVREELPRLGTEYFSEYGIIHNMVVTIVPNMLVNLVQNMAMTMVPNMLVNLV